MRKELSPAVSGLLLLMFGAMLWLVFLLRGTAVGLPTLSHMHTSPDGRLFIMLGTDLFEHDESGLPIRRIDLRELGVIDVIGDFAFFNDGDLLIRIGVDNRSLSDKLRQYFRRDNLKPTHLKVEKSGLFRCDLSAMQCMPFGKQYNNFDQSFYLAVDWESDRVLVADSSRHRLLLFSSTGDLLAETRQGLKYPNQVIYRNGLAYVANANRHEVAVFEVGESSLKRTVRGFLAAEVGTQLRGHIWTSSVMAAGDQFWVVNSDSDMANGIVVRFDRSGERLGELELPELADVFSVESFRSEMLVNDLRAGKIYRYSYMGDRMPDFQSSLLDAKLHALAQEKESYYRWMYIVIGLFFITFIAGLVIGLRREMAIEEQLPTADSEHLALDPDTPGIHWISIDSKFTSRIQWIGWFLVVVCLLLISLLWVLIGTELPIDFVLASITILSLVIAVKYLLSRFVRQQLGVRGDSVIAIDGGGSYASARSEHLRYSENRLVVGDVVITLRTNQSLFPEEQLVAHLYPLLKSGQYLTQMQMLRVVMELRPIQSAFAVVGMLSLVLIVILLVGGEVK
jgi:hypothetical protein